MSALALLPVNCFIEDRRFMQGRRSARDARQLLLEGLAEKQPAGAFLNPKCQGQSARDHETDGRNNPRAMPPPGERRQARNGADGQPTVGSQHWPAGTGQPAVV